MHRCSHSVCVNSIRSRNARTTHPLNSTVRLWLASDGKRRRAAPSPSRSRSRSRSRSVYHPSFASLFRTGAERACARAVLIGVCVRARVGNSPVLLGSFIRSFGTRRTDRRTEGSVGRPLFFCFRSRRVPEQPSVGERFRRTIDRASERFEIGIAIGSAD